MALETGYMTTRSSFDEGFYDDEQNLTYERMAMNVSLEVVPSRKSRWGTFIQRVQGKHPHWNVGIVNLPYYLGFEVFADDEKLNMELGRITGYTRWLNMKTATLYRSFIWETSNGKKLNLLFTRFMNPDDKFMCVQNLKIKLIEGDSANIRVKSYVDNDVRTNGHDKFVRRTVGANTKGDIIYSDVTANLDDRIVTVSRMACDCPGCREDCAYTVTKHDRRVDSEISFVLDNNDEANILKASAQVADIYFDRELLLEQGAKMISSAIEQGLETLHIEHIARWARNWETSDIQIDSNDPPPYNSQLAIRKAIYHLFRARSTDPRALNCAKGTSTEMYLGSVCWDMEIFFQPFYLYTQPELAKMTHMYRYYMLDGARRSAKSMNYKGARYPWQTDRYGDEVCPMFEYADHQIHITADIVIGLWHYYLNSQDKDYLFKYGIEIILETSRYWTTRVNKLPHREGWHILGVMGPDEYKPITNNNAYTNFVVRESLRLASVVVDMCKAEAPDIFNKLCDRIGFDESELDLFNEIADSLTIPKCKERDIIWQCDDFDTSFAEIDIQGLWKDKTKLFGFYATQELRYRSKCLKQSDVIALMGLYTEAFTKEEMAASVDYYFPFTIHDSSNSICHNAIVSACLDRPEDAYKNWMASMDIDFGARPRASDGVHFANIGGMWQEIVLGFAGMVNALGADVLTFRPCMPKEINTLSFKIIWKGQQVAVNVDKKTITLKNLSGKELNVKVADKPLTISAGDVKTVEYR
jgi:kojibiose phosphorylase